MLYKGLENKSLKSFDLNECNIYRGTYIEKDELEKLKNFNNTKYNKKLPCSILYSKTFLSFNKEENCAFKFMFSSEKKKKTDETPVIFLIKKRKPYKINYISNADLTIDSISKYPDEKEVLFFPFSCFTVENIEEKKYIINNTEINYSLIRLDYLGRYEDKIFEAIYTIKENDLIKDIESSEYIYNIKQFEGKIKSKIIDDQLKNEYYIIYQNKETNDKETNVGNICNICILKNYYLCYLKKDCENLKIIGLNKFQLEIFDKDSNSKVNYIMELRDGRLLICSLDYLIKIIEIDFEKLKYEFKIKLKGHTNLITKVIELKNEKLCSCSFDGVIKLWKKNKDNIYELQYNLKGFQNGQFYSLLEINEIIFSLLSFKKKKFLHFMDLKKIKEEKKELNDINLKRENLIQLNDNNLIIGGIKVIYIYKINTKDEIEKIKCDYIICSLLLLKDNGILFGDDQGNLVKIKDLKSFKIIFEKKHDKKEEINSLCQFSENKIGYKNKEMYIISKIIP
jgi:WD40 repeat protein